MLSCVSAPRRCSAGDAVPVWVRNAWVDTESAVKAEALQASPTSPTVFVFLHRAADAEMKKALASLQAAADTLAAHGVPTTVSGQEAVSAIQTRSRSAEADLRSALQQIFRAPLVLQAGGSTDLPGATLAEKVDAALQVSLSRLYPRFDQGDDPRWDSVLTRARNGDGAPLKPLDWSDNTEKHPVCAAVLQAVGPTGKKGSDIRSYFTGKNFGWPRDTIDGALLALCAGGHLRVRVTRASLSTLARWSGTSSTSTIFTPRRSR